MGIAGWDIVGATLVTVLTAGPFPAASIESGTVESQHGGNTTMSRVRTADPDIRRAIAQAAERSQTFRRLVEAIERTDGVVWVSRGRCGSGAWACLLTYLIVSGPNRLLHIHVAPRRSGDELMESIGHELQHVVEVLGSSARNTAEMYNFFEYSPGVYRVGDRFETREAVEAGFAVGREIARVRQPNRTEQHMPDSRESSRGVGTPALTAGGSDPVDPPAPVTTMLRTRTDDPEIARAITQAIQWSDTFRIGGRFETRAAQQAGIAVGREVARARRVQRPDNREP